jgi:hypothetical protein
MVDKMSDKFLEMVVGGEEATWSEQHDMAVELILSRRLLDPATPCASCGLNRHTPLRRDDMGGYVCLTCIDERLTRLAPMARAWYHHNGGLL